MTASPNLAQFQQGAQLVEFLMTLETDRAAMARYLKNPVQTMQKFGLSQATITAIMSGDSGAINDLINAVTGIPMMLPVYVHGT